MLITGIIAVDRMHPESPRNVALEASDEPHLDLYQKFAQSCKENGCRAIAQIAHGGRQTCAQVNGHPLAPSDVKLQVEGIPGFMWGDPQPMTTQQIHETMQKFVTAAKLCQKAGFDGVELHACHGYLISQLLSPAVNGTRTDGYGGPNIEDRMRFLKETVQAVRQECGPSFAVAVKLNSCDFSKGGSTEEDNLAVLAMLEREKVDFVEISGGTYESFAFMGAGVGTAEKAGKGEVYFLDFAKKARKTLTVPLMISGGFRRLSVMEEALASGACDIIGLGRPICLDPDFPNKLLTTSDPDLKAPKTGVDWDHTTGLIKTFEALWYVRQIGFIADGKPTRPDLGWTGSLGISLEHLVYEPQIRMPTRWLW